MKGFCVRSLTIFGLFAFLLTGCLSNERPLPDVSEIDAPLEVRRFEQALFQLDTTADFAGELTHLSSQFPEFLELFSANVIQAGSLTELTQEQVDYWRGFVAFPGLRKLQDTVQVVYGDMSDITTELQQALRYFRYYFPDQPAPERLTTFVSEYSYAAFIFGENELAVGLDMFLGADYPYQKYNPNNPFFSNYLTRTYDQAHLNAKVLQVLVEDMVGQPSGDRMLDIMVHNGKKLYLLDQLLPLAPDSIKLEVTGEQADWLVDNELNMWSFFLAEELLYSNRYQDFRKLVEPSPTGSPLLPEESPGRAANFMGWQIIKAFMQRNTEIPVSEMLLYQDAQEILELSRYKPKRK